MSDIIEAMNKARKQTDSLRQIPARFEVHQIEDFKLAVKDLTVVKSDKPNSFEYAGIKIVRNEKVPPGFVHVLNAQGEVLQRYTFV